MDTPRQLSLYSFNEQGDKIKYLYQNSYLREITNHHLIYTQKQLIADSLSVVDTKGKDSLISVFLYSYDHQARLIEEKELNRKMRLEQRKTYSYDPQGRLWEKKWYVGKSSSYNVPACGGDPTFYRKWIYLYDQTGNLTGEAELTPANCKLWENDLATFGWTLS